VICLTESKEREKGMVSVANKSKIQKAPNKIPIQQKVNFLNFGLNFTIELMMLSIT